jgi:ABC-type multidrug transport system, ATPase component
MATDHPLLDARGIAAGYHGRRIIHGIDLTVRPGDFAVLLGANGSGKSTLMRALSGQIALHEGTVEFGGINLSTSPEAAKHRFGYAVEASDLPRTLTGTQYLDLIASIRRCPPRSFPPVPAPHRTLIDALQFTFWLNQPIAAYSLGTSMKLSILGALLGTPDLIMLDESLNGLDPLILARTRRVLAALCAAGHGVILSTHMLGTIGNDCSEILFLGNGTCTHRWSRADIAAARQTPGGLDAMVVNALESA